MSDKRTVHVDASVYEHALPDWYEGETVPITVTAFSGKVYLDFPRFSTVERKAGGLLQNDSVLHNFYDDGSPLDRSEVDSMAQAIQLILDRKDDGCKHVPDNTNQYCAKLSSILQASVQIGTPHRAPYQDDVAVSLCKKLIDDDLQTGSPDGVTRLSLASDDDYHEMHHKLALMVEMYTDGIKQDDYWRGYYNAANLADSMDWADIAWKHVCDDATATTAFMLDVGEWMAREGETVCNRSNAWFAIPHWGRPTGSYVNTIYEDEAAGCPNCGADKDKHWECIKSSNRTRVPNTYKCQECGTTKKGITTG